MSGFFKSSIGRKFAMALSALFLMSFLVIHVLINLTSLFPDGGKMFNQLSHFMGTNPLIQFAMQPILIAGVVYHFVAGFVLEIQNKRARGVNKYARNNGAANSTWMSRNMIISGAVILAFLGLHFVDFWIPEMTTKYINGDFTGMHDGAFRYYHEMTEKFHNPIRVGAYVISFVLLALHLMHGFTSAFQSIGVDAKSPKASNKYKPALELFGKVFSIGVPAAFILVALFHFFNQH